MHKRRQTLTWPGRFKHSRRAAVAWMGKINEDLDNQRSLRIISEGLGIFFPGVDSLSSMHKAWVLFPESGMELHVQKGNYNKRNPPCQMRMAGVKCLHPVSTHSGCSVRALTHTCSLWAFTGAPCEHSQVLWVLIHRYFSSWRAIVQRERTEGRKQPYFSSVLTDFYKVLHRLEKEGPPPHFCTWLCPKIETLRSCFSIIDGLHG